MRLDLYLADKLSPPSRSRAALVIKKGLVTVNGQIMIKSAYEVGDNDIIEVMDMPYSSQGGYKLELALDTFCVDVKDKVCADIGASNGGFTDCLLKRGASRVYAVDVGECALPEYLVNDKRVIVKDKLNARYIIPNDLGESVDIAVIDVSYISLKLILPQIKGLLSDNGIIIALIKPQFEAGKANLSKNGIVTEEKIRQRVIADIKDFCITIDLEMKQYVEYKPFERNKNIEFPALFVPSFC